MLRFFLYIVLLAMGSLVISRTQADQPDAEEKIQVDKQQASNPDALKKGNRHIKSSFSRIRDEYRIAQASGRLREFILRHAQNMQYSAWLNSDDITCSEFFTCLSEMHKVGSTIPNLDSNRQAIHEWYIRTDRLVESTGKFRGYRRTLLNNIDSFPPMSDSTAMFILSRTTPSYFCCDTHEILFLYVFATSISDGRHRDILIHRILDEPAWITSPEVLSLIAPMAGPKLVELLLRAAQKTVTDKDYLVDAIEYLTGLEYTDSNDKFFRTVEKWYFNNKERLVIDESALYPAPIGPIFFRSERTK